MASGTPTALPTSTPATFERAHELCEKRFTAVALSTDQPPCSNRPVFTPELSSVTVAENRNASRLRTPSQRGANEAA